MFTKYKTLFAIIVLTMLGSSNSYSQEENKLNDNKDLYRKVKFFDLRGTNAIDAAVGFSLINNDYPKPEFELYFRLGYKHHVTDHLNINLTYNKYNIAFDEVFNEGYMSFDLNLEYLFNPYSEFTPYLYGGFGYNASNYFETTHTKVQFGLGLEYVVVEGVGIKLFGEFNNVFSDELEGLIIPNEDDSFIRAGIGVNLYFGGNKRKERLLSSIETIINSNLIK